MAHAIQIAFNKAVDMKESYKRHGYVHGISLANARKAMEDMAKFNVSNSKEIKDLLALFQDTLDRKGKGTYAKKNIESIQSDCQFIADRLGISHLIKWM